MNIVEDEKYLKNESDINGYFEDVGYDYFECGQGYYEDETEVFIKIEDNYFVVHMTAEILGDKQDRGDRLYYVDEITSVTHTPISKETILEMQNVSLIKQIAFHEKEIEQLKAKLIT